jgi:pSer/pThr/pTyr-binding forkhead associated (FHA) protein
MLETADNMLLGPSAAPAAQEGALGLVVIGLYGMRALPLRAGCELVIGRDPSCDISLPEPALSRFHARFVGHATHVEVIDLGSRHGVWVDGKRIESAQLVVGASVRLADVVVTVSFEPQAQEHAWLKGNGSGAPHVSKHPTSETLRSRMATLERDEAQRALAQTKGNQRLAAELLGMPLRTFERRLRAWRAQGAETLPGGSAPASDEPQLG